MIHALLTKKKKNDQQGNQSGRMTSMQVSGHQLGEEVPLDCSGRYVNAWLASELCFCHVQRSSVVSITNMRTQ